MKNTKLYPIKNTLCFVLCVYINFLSATGQLGGKNIRELSEKYDNLFTPSNQTFAIWSLIYTLLLLVLVGQFIKKVQDPVLQTPLFMLSCFLNFSWIIAWQQESIGISLLIMIGLLICLARINKSIKSAPINLLKITFGVYLGWICIATIANVTTFLTSLHVPVNIEMQRQITQAIIIIGMGIVLWVASNLKNPSILLPVLWAFYGIYVKRQNDYPTIGIVAMGSCILIVIVSILYYLKTRYKPFI